MVERGPQHRRIETLQEAADGMSLLSENSAACEGRQQRRDQRDGQHRAGGNAQEIRKGQGLEHPAFLRLEDEHGQEGDPDHE